MFNLKHSAAILLSLLLSCTLSAQPLNVKPLDWQTQKITRGLTWQQLRTDELFNTAQNINLLRIKTKKRPVGIVAAGDSLLLTSALGAAREARAAINGSYFDMVRHHPSTYLKVDGKILAGNDEQLDKKDSELIRGAVVVADDGQVIIEPTRPETFYQLSDDYEDVLVTGPLLIVDGEARSLEDNNFNNNRHPRSCACLVRKNELLLITVDGRNAQAAGMSLPELTRLLLGLGCKQAVNLDGGGSTTLWIKGQPGKGVVNMPSDNGAFDHAGERRVANGIVVW